VSASQHPSKKGRAGPPKAKKKSLGGVNQSQAEEAVSGQFLPPSISEKIPKRKPGDDPPPGYDENNEPEDDAPPPLFKARSYIIRGQKRPGKTHSLREHDIPTSEFVTFCGLKPGCPGDLIEQTRESVIDCKTCIGASAHPYSSSPKIAWVFSWRFDDDPCWTGYVWGREMFLVYRGSWCSLEDGEGNGLGLGEDGRETCQAHLESMPRHSWGWL